MSTIYVDDREGQTDFVESYTGRKVYPMDIRPQDVSIIDVAHHLSMKCRYGGATEPHYSVAQHSVAIATHHIKRHKDDYLGGLKRLFHDAGEYVFPDIQRPIKHLAPELVKGEEKCRRLVWSMIGIGDHEETPDVKSDDKRITQDERLRFMSDSGNVWLLEQGLEPLGVNLAEWTPRFAEEQFKKLYAVLMYGLHGDVVYSRSHEDYPWGPSVLTHASADLPEDKIKQDWIEVDVVGGVACVLDRTEDGMLVRDRKSGDVRPAVRWVRGDFAIERGVRKK